MLRRYFAAIVPILTLALFAPLALASTSLTGTYRTEVTTPASLKGTWSFKFAHGRDSQSLNGKEIAHGTYTISGATIKFANAATPSGSGSTTCKTPGTYKLTLSDQTLKFTKISDPCNSVRAQLLSHKFTKA
jgi:hypothetical protein